MNSTDWRKTLVRITYEEFSAINNKWKWQVVRRKQGADADATLARLRSKPDTIRSVHAQPEV